MLYKSAAADAAVARASGFGALRVAWVGRGMWQGTEAGGNGTWHGSVWGGCVLSCWCSHQKEHTYNLLYIHIYMSGTAAELDLNTQE